MFCFWRRFDDVIFLCCNISSGQNRQQSSLKECVFNNSALKIQCHCQNTTLTDCCFGDFSPLGFNAVKLLVIEIIYSTTTSPLSFTTKMYDPERGKFGVVWFSFFPEVLAVQQHSWYMLEWLKVFWCAYEFVYRIPSISATF